MKQMLLLTSVIFFISGCGEEPKPPIPVIIPPEKPVCLFPKLPIYQIPPKKKMTTPVHIEGDKYAVIGSELKDLLVVNTILRSKCEKHNYINQKINEEYQK